MGLHPALIVGTGSTTGESIPLTGTNAGGAVVLDAGTGDAGNMRRVWIYGVNIEAGVRHKAFIIFGNALRVIPCQVLADIGIQTLVPGLPLQDDQAVSAYADVGTSKVELYLVRSPA